MEPALAVGISITVIMLSALFFDRMRFPHVLGVLVAGILIGPYSPLAGVHLLGINFSNIIITEPSLVETFAVMGAALILFGIGLEFSAIKLSQLGGFTFLAAVLKIGIVYVCASLLLSMLGFSGQASALMAVALSFSSTPIIVKLLEDSGKIKRPESNFIISILVIEDLLIVFFLGLLANSSAEASEYSFAISLARVILTFVFAYFILSKLISRFLELVAHSDELTILATVSLVLVIGYFAAAIGLSFSVGAFLAGSIIAGSPHSRKIEEKIKPFNSLFASFFFFSIGLAVNVGGVLSDLSMLAILIIIGVIIRFIAAGTAAYFAGFPGRGAAFCAAAFLSLSELSLLLIREGSSAGMVPQEFLGSFAFAIIATSFLSAWLINRENEIYNFVLAASPQMIVGNLRLARSTMVGMRRAVAESSRYYNVVDRLPSIAYRTDSLSVREKLIITSKNSVLLFTVAATCFFGIFLAQTPDWRFLDSFFVFLFIGFIVSSALFMVNALSASNALLAMVGRSSTGSKYSAVGHVLSAIFFLVVCAICVWCYSLAPASLAIILAVPAFLFALRSALSAARVLMGGRRL